MPIFGQKASFGPNLAVYGPKIGTHVTENPPRHLVLIVFWWGMGSNGPKMPIFGQKASFGPNLAVYGPKILISMGVSKILVPT